MTTPIVIELYRLDTRQKFEEGHVTLTQATTNQIESAQNSNFVDLLKALVSTAQHLQAEIYGSAAVAQPIAQPVINTEHVLIQLLIQVEEDEQAAQLQQLVNHAVRYGASYLQITGKFNCLASGRDFETPESRFALIESVTEKHLQELFGQSYRTRKFTGLRLLGSDEPETLAVRRILNPVTLGASGELVELSGVVKNFDHSGVIDFHPDGHNPMRVYFEPRSFLSAEHELYYHQTDARFDRKIELNYRFIDGKCWLVPIDLTALDSAIRPKQLMRC